MSQETEFDNARWINLASPRLDAQVIFATDDFFAPKERLIQAHEPVWLPDKYDEHGKWMDGWESRRKRVDGHDYCIVRLGLAGVIRAVDIDTRYFTGNYPPEASLEACASATDPGDATRWLEIVPRSPLQGDAHNYFEVDDARPWTHVRLNIFPDGGVARLRIFGEVRCDAQKLAEQDMPDLIAVENGGRALACSDEHYGRMQNLLMPGPGINMGDGWETRRRRGPGNDWVVIRLGHPGLVKKAEVDTTFFKGNYPDRVSIEALCSPNDVADPTDPGHTAWVTLLPEQRLDMDKKHVFESELLDLGSISHVRIDIFPDGGLSRVRLFGIPKPG